MNGDIEALLRSGLAEQAERAPRAVEDPALADLAIAGAHRIRRRRRVGAAAGGAGLLVLGAGVFAFQPLMDMQDQGTIAADSSSTEEVRSDLGMEFLVEDDDGYAIVNEDGKTIPVGADEPESVLRLQDAYVLQDPDRDKTDLYSLDGSMSASFASPAPETYGTVNIPATEYAMVTPNAEMTEESYALNDVTLAAVADATTFSVSYDLTLVNWDSSTAVFTADVWSTTGGSESTYYFNDQNDWNLASVAAAGFESVAVIDSSNTGYVCVADLDAFGGVAREGEECGPFETERMKDDLVATAGTDGALATVTDTVDRVGGEVYFPMDSVDLGDYQDQFYTSSMLFADPYNRWEISYDPGDATWMMVDYTGETPVMSLLTPPSGAVFPVMDYVRSE
ncbi:hypothetical protein [Glycomyces sp. NPDC047010]|uniref:hypothetical protein n=1 Tax=Glycomyces sp. NPDC047010 TaxID=3155023 RepID=UPI0033EE39E3